MGSEAVSAATDEAIGLVGGYLDDVAVRLHRALGEILGVAVTMSTDGGGPVTAGASTVPVRDVDRVQYAIGTGPCLNALHGGGGAYIPDLAADERWGEYGPQAAALGARSCLSVPVEVNGAVAAVLKVYAEERDGLDAGQRERATATAPEIAGGVALAQRLSRTARELDDRVVAMDSRRTIDIAIGILVERVGCDADEAFGLLRRQSQHRNVPLYEVAAGLVQAGSASDDSAPFRPRGRSSSH